MKKLKESQYGGVNSAMQGEFIQDENSDMEDEDDDKEHKLLDDYLTSQHREQQLPSENDEYMETGQIISGSHGKMQIVTPGQLITKNAEGVLRGHGTYVENGKLFAAVCGFVERVNKLISVRPMRARYTGEVGDVVIGRIVELRVNMKRWKVDVQGRQDATLLLSSVNLPGGVQRRKTYEDQLNMRNLYVENDLISAEVQQVFQDGSLSLQTRSARYGKLDNGTFVKVDSALVKRCKQHFHTFSFGVQVILGNNGYIWLSIPNIDQNNQKEYTPFMAAKKTSSSSTSISSDFTISGKDRENICRVRNAIKALQSQFLPIYPETIGDVYQSSIQLPPQKMLSREIIPLITASAAERVQKLAQEQHLK